MQLHVDVLDDEEEDLLEVVKEFPQYMAVVHFKNKSSKGPGIVILTSKTLKPKCIVCPASKNSYGTVQTWVRTLRENRK